MINRNSGSLSLLLPHGATHTCGNGLCFWLVEMLRVFSLFFSVFFFYLLHVCNCHLATLDALDIFGFVQGPTARIGVHHAVPVGLAHHKTDGSHLLLRALLLDVRPTDLKDVVGVSVKDFMLKK